MYLFICRVLFSAVGSPMEFRDKLSQIVEKNKSLLCVGLDVDQEKMPSFLSESDGLLLISGLKNPTRSIFLISSSISPRHIADLPLRA